MRARPYAEALDGVAGRQLELGIDGEAVSPRELLGKNDRAGIDQKGEEFLRTGLAIVVGEREQAVVPDRPILEGVDAEHTNGFARAVRRRSQGIAFDYRTHVAVWAQPADLVEEELVEAGPGPVHFERRLAGDGLDCRLEAPD